MEDERAWFISFREMRARRESSEFFSLGKTKRDFYSLYRTHSLNRGNGDAMEKKELLISLFFYMIKKIIVVLK